VTVPFPKATTRQVRDATALVLHTNRARKAAPVEPAMIERGKALAAALPAFGEGRGERVRFSTAADGRVAVSFAEIPMDRLEEFLGLVRVHLGGG
jgi:hypothetical protein